MITDFKLTPQERDTPLWKKLSAYLGQRLDDLRLQNDNEKLADLQTAALRGRIVEVKEMLHLAEDRPTVTIKEG